MHFKSRKWNANTPLREKRYHDNERRTESRRGRARYPPPFLPSGFPLILPVTLASVRRNRRHLKLNFRFSREHPFLSLPSLMAPFSSPRKGMPSPFPPLGEDTSEGWTLIRKQNGAEKVKFFNKSCQGIPLSPRGFVFARTCVCVCVCVGLCLCLYVCAYTFKCVCSCITLKYDKKFYLLLITFFFVTYIG